MDKRVLVRVDIAEFHRVVHDAIDPLCLLLEKRVARCDIVHAHTGQLLEQRPRVACDEGTVIEPF